MKIGFLHTRTSIVEKTAFEEALKALLPSGLEFCHVENGELLDIINRNGVVEKKAFEGLLKLYEKLLAEGCDLIISTCTAAGTAATALNNLYEFTRVPVLSVDEGICEEGLALGTRFIVVGSSIPAIERIHARLEEVSHAFAAAEHLKLAFPADSTRADKERLIIAAVQEQLQKTSANVILLAQPSLDFAAQAVFKATGVNTLGAIGATADKVKKLLSGR